MKKEIEIGAVYKKGDQIRIPILKVPSTDVEINGTKISQKGKYDIVYLNNKETFISFNPYMNFVSEKEFLLKWQKTDAKMTEKQIELANKVVHNGVIGWAKLMSKIEADMPQFYIKQIYGKI